MARSSGSSRLTAEPVPPKITAVPRQYIARRDIHWTPASVTLAATYTPASPAPITASRDRRLVALGAAKW
jgi:hypothetical protein